MMKKKRSKRFKDHKIVYIQKISSSSYDLHQTSFEIIKNFSLEFGETIFISNQCEFQNKIQSMKIKTYKIPITSILLFPFALITMAFILLKEKPDIIHSNHHYTTFLVQLLRFILPMKYRILHTARSVITLKTGCRFLGDKIITNSETVYKNLVDNSRITPDKIEVIYDGIELNMNGPIRFSQQNDPVFQILDVSPKTIIGCIGSLVKSNGHEYLLKAITALPKTVQDNILVLIVGEGPLRKKLEANVQSANLTKVIKFLGFRADAHHIMSYCHFLVIPSIRDGLPGGLIEGYLLGKPSIVSESDYVPEILIPHKCSLVFPPGDITKLSESIQFYIENPKLAARHGAKGKRVFKRMFSLKKNLKNYRSVYQNLLEIE